MDDVKMFHVSDTRLIACNYYTFIIKTTKQEIIDKIEGKATLKKEYDSTDQVHDFFIEVEEAIKLNDDHKLLAGDYIIAINNKHVYDIMSSFEHEQNNGQSMWDPNDKDGEEQLIWQPNEEYLDIYDGNYILQIARQIKDIDVNRTLSNLSMLLHHKSNSIDIKFIEKIEIDIAETLNLEI
eukprot:541852_1